MLKFIPVVLLLSLSYLRFTLSHAGYLYGGGLKVYKNDILPTYEDPVVRFAYASAPILKYGIPIQLRAYESPAPVALPQIKYTLGAPVTTTTTSYVGYPTSAQPSSFGASAYVATRAAPHSIPAAYVAAAATPLPIFKYTQPTYLPVAAAPPPPPEVYASSAW